MVITRPASVSRNLTTSPGYAKVLNVSADWLLGIESARRPDIVRVAELKSDVDRLVSDAARIKKGLDELLAEGVPLRT